MTVLTHAIGRLDDMLPHLRTMARSIDDGARFHQVPHPRLVDNLARRAADLESIAHDLTEAGIGGLGRELGSEALSTARRAGVLHAMQENGRTLNHQWLGVLRGTIDQVTSAVAHLR